MRKRNKTAYPRRYKNEDSKQFLFFPPWYISIYSILCSIYAHTRAIKIPQP